MWANKFVLLLLCILAQAGVHAAPPEMVGAATAVDGKPAAAAPSASPASNTAAQAPRKTIDDIIQSAQKKGAPMSEFAPSSLSPPGTSAATSSAMGSKSVTLLPPPPNLSMPLPPTGAQPSQGPVLVGLYLNHRTATAEFNIDGYARYLGVGGRLPGGWVIEKITPQAVHLNKCVRSRECELKVLYYEAS